MKEETKRAKLQMIFDGTGTSYMRNSRLRIDLVDSLSKKLSRKDIDQLWALLALSYPRNDKPAEESG